MGRRNVLTNKHIMHTLEVRLTTCAQQAEFTVFGSKVGLGDDPTDANLPNRLVVFRSHQVEMRRSQHVHRNLSPSPPRNPPGGESLFTRQTKLKRDKIDEWAEYFMTRYQTDLGEIWLVDPGTGEGVALVDAFDDLDDESLELYDSSGRWLLRPDDNYWDLRETGQNHVSGLNADAVLDQISTTSFDEESKQGKSRVERAVDSLPMRNPTQSDSTQPPNTTVTLDLNSDGPHAYNPTKVQVSNNNRSVIRDAALRRSVLRAAKGIIRVVGNTNWFQSAILFRSPESIDHFLSLALRDFINDLETEFHQLKAPMEDTPVEARTSIRQYRERAARYIRVTLQKLSFSSRLSEHSSPTPSKVPPPLQLMKLLHARGVSRGGEGDGHVSDKDSQDHLDSNTVDTALFWGRAFSNLCVNVRERLYDTKPPMLYHIKSMIADSMPLPEPTSSLRSSNIAQQRIAPDEVVEIYSTDRRPRTVLLDTDWHPQAFLASQFGCQPTRLGSVITYTGFASCAFATTCLEYLRMFWPLTGVPFIQALEKLCDTIEERSYCEIITGPSGAYLIKLWLSPIGCLQVKITGEPEIIAEVAQEVVWISTALRIPPGDHGCHHYSNGSIAAETIPSDGSFDADCDALFFISCNFEKISPKEQSCWLRLVDHTAVVAHHFPIPRRESAQGLEVPLEILREMAGIHFAVDFRGGIIMKGPFTMLVPIARRNDIVQWHLISNLEEGQRLSYQAGLDQCKHRALTDQVDLESLKTTRAVVGWCSQARTMLGMNEMNYCNIDYSTAEASSASLRFSGGAIGVQQFAVAQIDFVLGPKESKASYKRSGTFRQVIGWAATKNVILYDITEKRGWLVKAVDVILHIVQTKNWNAPFSIQGKRLELKIANSPARSLQLNEQVVISDDGETFNGMVTRIWSLLEVLSEEGVQSCQSPDREVSVSFQQKLSGYEFMGVVEERSPLPKKQCHIAKTSGGWTQLVDDIDIDALVLFASAFEDLIQPAKDLGLCHQWRTVPKGNDYLGTTVAVLRDLFKVAGCKLSLDYLTSSKLCWHCEDKLFEPCDTPSAFFCSCNRLQQVRRGSQLGAIDKPKTLEEDGGVIFGNKAPFCVPLRSRPKKKSRECLYKQENAQMLSCLPLGGTSGGEDDGGSQTDHDTESEN
ncbi:hypothetical protein BKA56DRAFT_620496 [Ilyonectria sp. MPI-CAGE-AT-0026]|nr:hypothetical protein BKA56DRAFT_620496 [Ilyonectria sp. MPI-CAGE-AT-0026]